MKSEPPVNYIVSPRPAWTMVYTPPKGEKAKLSETRDIIYNYVKEEAEEK